MSSAVIKIRGEHTLDYALLTLVDNGGGSINCSAEATYSEYSDETVILITPQGSNTVGGAGNSWGISGTMTLDGVELGVNISSPAPSVEIVSITPELPNATYSDVVITMSSNVNVDDCVEHLQVIGYSGGLTEPLELKTDVSSIGPPWMQVRDPYMAWKVEGNVITIRDVSSGHGYKIYSVAWG